METQKFVSAIILITLLEVLSLDHHFAGGGGLVVDAHPFGNIRSRRESIVEASGAASSTSEKSKAITNPDKKNTSVVATALADTKSSNSNSTPQSKTSKPGSNVKEHTLVIPDRSPNQTLAQMQNENLDEDEDDPLENKNPGQGNFDEKAVQRALIVIAGIAVIIVTYLGIKFVLIKKRKVVKRYGRVEASEMDLLDEIEEEESEEEEELFDINHQRRS